MWGQKVGDTYFISLGDVWGFATLENTGFISVKKENNTRKVRGFQVPISGGQLALCDFICIDGVVIAAQCTATS